MQYRNTSQRVISVRGQDVQPGQAYEFGEEQAPAGFERIVPNVTAPVQTGPAGIARRQSDPGRPGPVPAPGSHVAPPGVPTGPAHVPADLPAKHR